ncbi:serine/threonine-protein phosphatase 6 regulatory subunit 3-like isoform X3 [Anneissia japonica]|uniref:serine/threonine-protein phosphatase 6 regulatory subunit 3-like isoform X3 n=1 Tax=Anneissia japonica TaxID=1529436 RepID=UPI001425A487|nr:serine/threonine-protein phosphatase 6 regulatory subunit 3-like isoform X3 [Anneissia japonica]
MFWKFEVHSTSHVDTLLEKEHVTLAELLDEDDVLQECKAQNRKLIEFLTRTDIMQEMLSMVTEEPEENVEEKLRYKHPNMACELLSSDVYQIVDKLADTESLSNQLWSFLDKESPLNPLLASFFSKVISMLISRRPEMVVDNIKNKENCIGIFLKHFGTSAIMDLLLRLVTCIEVPELRNDFLEWLTNQKLIQRLVDQVDPEEDDNKHSNASQAIVDIIRLTREHMSQLQESAEVDPLLSTIEKEETVAELLEHMFHEKKSESALTNGVTILLALLEFRKSGPDGQEQMTQLDAERLAKGISGVLKGLLPKLCQIHDILVDPPKHPPMPTTTGELDPPFGNSRLQVSKLIASLLITNSPSINSELSRLGTMKVLLDLFFQYLWNNFLHLEVEKCITTILSNSPVETDGEKPQHPLLVQLFTDCRLVQRILDAWEENTQIQSQPGGNRRGYMGHLTRIVNVLVENNEKGNNSEQIQQLIQEHVPEDYREKWNKFIVNQLAETNKRNTVDLVGSHPLHSSSEDDDSDFKGIQFGQETTMQQAFSDYQMQQMTSHFIDQFGFNDEEFAEQDENVNNPFDRIAEVKFSIPANENNPNSALFDACCNEKIQEFNDSSDEEDDMFEVREMRYPSNVESRSSNHIESRNAANDSDNSTDSEDETKDEGFETPKVQRPNDDHRMDVESTAAWTANFGNAPPESSVAMDTTPVGWDQPSSRVEDTGWANFDDFDRGFRSDSASQSAPRSSSPIAMDSESADDATPEADRQAGVPYMVTAGSPSETESSSKETTPRATSQDALPESEIVEPMQVNEETSGAEGQGTQGIKLLDHMKCSKPEDDQEISSECASPRTDNVPTPVKLVGKVVSNVESSAVEADTKPDLGMDLKEGIESEKIPPNNTTAEQADQQNEGSPAPEAVQRVSENIGSLQDSDDVRTEDCKNIEIEKKEDCTNVALQSPVLENEKSSEKDASEDKDDDDLNDNFDFLSSSGLMKSPEQQVKTNAESVDVNDKVEQARLEAKQALESFVTETKQNGPI